jgi:hypothetical protein
MRMAAKVTALLMVALVLAACGGDGASPTTDRETDVSVDGEKQPETLAAYFGWETGDDPEAAQARYQEQETQVQELIRQCMAGEGFEYIPVQYPTPEFDRGFDEEEWVRTQGFGITTWFGNEEEQGRFDSDWVDPNQEIVEAMSDSEREAYYEALYGPPDQGEPQMDPETGETYYVSEGWGGGCWGKASEEVYGQQNQGYEELAPELEQMWERIQNDPRIAEANQSWSACMAGKGFNFESEQKMHETIYEDFQKRFEEIVGPGGGYGDPFVGWSEEEIEAFFAEKSQDEIDAFFRAAQEEARADVDMVALAALQEEEIELAVANFECSRELRTLYEELNKEYEAAFIEEHRDQLEAIRQSREG